MPLDSGRSPGAQERSVSESISPRGRRSSTQSVQTLPPIIDHLTTYPNSPYSESLVLPALFSLNAVAEPKDAINCYYPTPSSPSDMERPRRPDEAIEENEWIYLFSEILRQAHSRGATPPASSILFQAIHNSGYEPVWEDLLLPGGRSSRSWQEGFRDFAKLSGPSIQPRRQTTSEGLGRLIAPKPTATSSIQGSSRGGGPGSPAVQSPLTLSRPTTTILEGQSQMRRKRGRPSNKDKAKRREQEQVDQEARQRRQISQSEVYGRYSTGPQQLTFGQPASPAATQQSQQPKFTPRAKSQNDSSGNSVSNSGGSSGSRRKRRNKQPTATGTTTTTEPPPPFGLGSRSEQPAYRIIQPQTTSSSSSSHARTASAQGPIAGQAPPLPPPRTSSIFQAHGRGHRLSQHVASSSQAGSSSSSAQQAQQAQLGMLGQQLQGQDLSQQQQQQRQQQHQQQQQQQQQQQEQDPRSEGKSTFGNLLNE